MRLTVFISFLLSFGLLAAPSYSQEAKINLEVKTTTVKSVLKMIEGQTNFRFFYNSELVDLDKEVTISLNNKNIDEALKSVFAGTSVGYRVMENNFVVLSSTEMLQQITVTGTVTDDTGAPIPGVNIVVKGTQNGVVTDVNGKYSISVPNKEAMLQFSFIGYATQELVVGGQKVLNIALSEDTKEIEEVVVVGYGTQKRSDLTGAISSVKSSDIKNIAARSITEAMQGKVAGVMINKNNGKPGEGSEIIIRGVGSTNGLNPLFIIDGVDRGNSVNYNPKDVESIEIIKDASAAAIYGAKAAGGVILITTKQGGFDQPTKVDFSANYGIRKITKTYDLMETYDYIPTHQAIGVDYGFWHDPNDYSKVAPGLPNTDWFNELYGNGKEQSYHLSLSGGSSKINYYLSAGYEREDGIQNRNYWERYSVRFNTNYLLHKNFSLKSHIYAAKVAQSPYTTQSYWRSLPYMSIYNDDGSFASVPTGVEFSGGNPVADIDQHRYNKGNHLLQADLEADWHIIDGLHLIATGAGSISSEFNDEWTQADKLRRSPSVENYKKEVKYNEGYTFTGVLKYSKVFALKHDFTLLAGYEVKNGMGSSLDATAGNFPVQDPWSFALSANTSKAAGGNLQFKNSPFLSQFARLIYSYDNRYILLANIRRDGSPKFGPNNKFGVFPSVSAAWKITEERFFKNWNLNWVNMIKPRVSYGILGNDAALDDFMYQQSYKTLGMHSYDEATILQGYNSVKVINKDIKWEEIRTFDVGLDLAFFSNKLTATFEYYKRDTRDMIYKLSIPWSSGIGDLAANPSQMPVNIGSIVNKGVEITLSYRNRIGNFIYSIGGNLAFNSNKVIDLGLPTAYIYDGSQFPAQTGQDQPFKTVNGQPVGQIYGLKIERMFNANDDMTALNDKAKQMYLDAGGAASGVNNIYYQQALTGNGDFKFVDMNGDGRITNADRTFIGNPWPKLTGGFNIYVEWKGIDLSMDAFGISGRDVLNMIIPYERTFVQDYNSTNKLYEASYFMGNGMTEHPRIVATNPANSALVRDPNYNYTYYSEYLVENGSYLKIKNITIGYTLPKQWTSRIKIDNLRVYVTGQNLFTFTKFTGLDPEFSNGDKGKTKHGLYGESTYPQTKLYSVGIDIGF